MRIFKITIINTWKSDYIPDFPASNFLHTLQFYLHSYLLCRHNILCTGNVYCYTYTSNLHVYRISSKNSFFSNIPLFPIHCTSVVYPQTYEHNLAYTLLLLFLHLFFYIIHSICDLYLLLFACI